MPLEIKPETVSSLAGFYKDAKSVFDVTPLFSIPIWVQSWWEAFGQDYDLLLRSGWQDGRLVGVAPLMRRDNTAYLIGSPDVCDYLDLSIAAKKETEFFAALLPDLQQEGIRRLELNTLRPEAAVFSGLLSREMPAGCSGNFSREDLSYEITLPSTWEDYLAGLKKKQRHEIRRKLRRLRDEAGEFQFRVIEEQQEVENFLPDFFDLFQQNPDKAEFLTAQMKQFFRLLVSATAREGLTRFGLLEVGETVAAAVLYFDYRGRIYLYNSGYHSGYSDVSAGLLSKVLCINANIERNRDIFDFLKGNEVYKSRLGGTAIPIYNTTISIS